MPTALEIIATVPVTGGFLGWTAVDLPFFILLPVLLLGSGFFSGSETALFGLSEAERADFRGGQTLAARAVNALLNDERMLLVTILLANMTINVLYFVVSSTLMMRADLSGWGGAALALGFLLIIVIGGEVGPKTAASAARPRFAALCAPPLFAVHRAIGPLRIVIAHGIVAPLSRLTAPPSLDDDPDEMTIRGLLAASGRDGVLDEDEQRLLHEVVKMKRFRVSDVMTPRVKMMAVPDTANRADVLALIQARRLTKLPVYRRDLDDIVGMLHVKRFLLAEVEPRVTDPAVMSPAHYAPDLATLDQLLDLLRRRRVQSAIVVDEYGGTEGIVSVEDVVEELVGDIVGGDQNDAPAPRLIGLGRWVLDGAMAVHAFEEAFALRLDDVKASTLSGLIAEQLGRAAVVGDVIALDDFELEVVGIERRRVAVAHLVALPASDDPEGSI